MSDLDHYEITKTVVMERQYRIIYSSGYAARPFPWKRMLWSIRNARSLGLVPIRVERAMPRESKGAIQ